MNGNDKGIRLLLVDDDPMSHDMLEGMLAREAGVAIRFISDPIGVAEAVRTFAPSLVLVDLRMPGSDGIDIIRLLRGDPATVGIPVVMLSGEVDPAVKAAGFAAGAADYMVKWPDRLELVARVRTHSNAYYAARERDQITLALAASRDALLQRSEQLTVAQAALHEAQKNEAIGKLTGAVAHDVNNVLHLINGHLQLMRMEQRDERLLRRIDAASDGVKRGTALTTQLLAMARGRSSTSVKIDLQAFLRGIEPTVFSPPGMAPCSLRLAEGRHYASLDPHELRNTLIELVKNAREATSDDGPVMITLDVEQVSTRTGRVPPGSYVRVRVVDSGPGMAPEVQRRAFEPFFSTKPDAQGAGLGLSLAAGFVRKHDGHIELESEPGQGTRVTLRFPRQAA